MLDALQRERHTHALQVDTLQRAVQRGGGGGGGGDQRRVTELENRVAAQEHTIKEGERAYVDIKARLGSAVVGLAQLEDRVATQAHTIATLLRDRTSTTLAAQRWATELENRVAAWERTILQQAQALAELSTSTTLNVETGEDEVELPLVAEAIFRKRRRETTPASALGKAIATGNNCIA